MKYISVQHKEDHERLKEAFTQFKRDNKEAMSFLYVLAASPKLEGIAEKSKDNEGYFQMSLFEENTQKLDGVEKVLASLVIALFNKQSFPLNTLDKLNNELLDVSLEAIKHCYKKSSGLYDVDHEPILIKEKPLAKYLGQTQVAEMMNKQGLEGDRRKINVYLKRGHLPEPNIMIGDSPGWTEEVIQEWIEDYKAGNIIKRRKTKKEREED